MIIVESYPIAVLMCVVTMLCWGFWGNTQKLASREWKYQLFYWDYGVSVLLWALVFAFTAGSTGSAGRAFLADLAQAEAGGLGWTWLGGVLFNLSNLLLVVAIDIAGMAVAFPIGVGLALVLGVVVTYLLRPEGNPLLLAGCVALIVAAIVLNALAYRRKAVAAARAGGVVSLVARLGTDGLGDETPARFATERIDARHVGRDPHAPSGVALIFVARSPENCIAVAPGANGRLTPADVRRADPLFAGSSAVVLQLEIPLAAVRAATALAVKHGVPVILNPAPARKLPMALLRQVSVLTPNETEAEVLTGRKVDSDAAAAQAARILHRRGVGTVIITLGARGALVSDATGGRLVPGFPVKAVDTTAAGDVFTGALAVACGEGRPLDEAVRFACAAAAVSVTRMGAQPSVPMRAEIDDLVFLGARRLRRHHTSSQ